MTSNNNLATQRVSAKAGSVRSVSSFTRPANTTAYAANDVIFETTPAAGVIEFQEVGSSGFVHGVTCIMGETDTVDLELILFGTEPTNIADNNALAIPSGDLDQILGIFALNDADKVNVGSNREVYETGARNPVAFTSDEGSLYGILVTRSAFTPSSGTPFALSLHIEADT